MKKIIILSALLLIIGIASKAQGNLQFNKVVSYTGTGNNWITIVLDTVKQNKVIKLESLGISNYGTGYLRINGKAYINVGNSQGGFIIHEAIWLKEGDIISYTSNTDYVITGIEYNIVP